MIGSLWLAAIVVVLPIRFLIGFVEGLRSAPERELRVDDAPSRWDNVRYRADELRGDVERVRMLVERRGDAAFTHELLADLERDIGELHAAADSGQLHDRLDCRRAERSWNEANDEIARIERDLSETLDLGQASDRSDRVTPQDLREARSELLGETESDA